MLLVPLSYGVNFFQQGKSSTLHMNKYSFDILFVSMYIQYVFLYVGLHIVCCAFQFDIETCLSLILHVCKSVIVCDNNSIFIFQLLHNTVVDTSVVFPHRLGPPFKIALRFLAADHLKRIIQSDGKLLLIIII